MTIPTPNTSLEKAMPAHTPGPWEAFDHAGDNMQSYSQSSGVHGTGKHVGTLVCGCFHDINGGKEVASANAEFIARACNSHDELLTALKEAESLVIGWSVHHAILNCTTPQEYAKASDISGWHPTHRAIYEKVKAAIAKAGGQ